MALLSKARQAIWRAIDSWPELTNVFALKLTWEEDQPLIVEAEPSLSEFPAVEVFPAGGVASQPFTQAALDWQTSFEIRVWTQGWSLPEVEALAEKIARAVYRAAPEGSSVTYVRDAVDGYPKLTALTIEAVRLADDDGEPADAVTATKLRMTFVLPVRFNSSAD